MKISNIGSLPLKSCLIIIFDVINYDNYQYLLLLADIPFGSNVTSLTCTDDDLGPNGNFSFAIVSGNTGDKFRMDDNRLLVNGDLDHERQSEYSLEIHVTDHGVPSHVTVVIVTVYVKAVNEITPTFQFSNYTVTISETTPIGELI